MQGGHQLAEKYSPITLPSDSKSEVAKRFPALSRSVSPINSTNDGIFLARACVKSLLFLAFPQALFFHEPSSLFTIDAPVEGAYPFTQPANYSRTVSDSFCGAFS